MQVLPFHHQQEVQLSSHLNCGYSSSQKVVKTLKKNVTILFGDLKGTPRASST